MTGDRIARVGFATQRREVTVVELIAAVALVVSIAVAGTAVSFGMTRAQAAPATMFTSVQR